jgi:hypothetical protein
MIARSLFVTASVMLLACSGCRKATVESYRIPKEKDPEMPMASAPGANAGGEAGAPMAPPGGGSMANTPVATAQGAELTWKAPDGWKDKPGSAMRKGSYRVPGPGGAEGDLSVTAFPGDVGGELANVNRWRSQVQLPPIAEADLASAVTRDEHDGLRFGVVDVTGSGPNPQRILGAFVPYGGATWFFKLAGPDAVIAEAKPAFLAFLQTVKPAGVTTQ